MLALRLPQDLEDRLTALAEKTGQSKSYHARKAIMEYIGDLEDYAIAEQTSRAIREGREKLHTIEAVERDLGLSDKNL